ncbi:hypothetical protein DFH09DRAFT_1367119 [Mycena vulgaris]|nr:hypothetical protein DFH09DRAFT_1367119 [Mycena vulgaris]
MGGRKRKLKSKRTDVFDGADSDPRQDEEKKTKRRVESHRKASAAYDARHPEVKERRRIFIAEQRAAAKLKKRKWDPPKKPARVASAAEQSDVGHSTAERERDFVRPGTASHTEADSAPSAIVLDLCVENLLMFDAEMGEQGEAVYKMASSEMQSLTPDEALALVALAGMAGGAASADAAPALETTVGRAHLLSSHRSSLRVLEGAAGLTLSYKIASSARVEQARVTVAALNSRPFSRLLLIDVWLWDEVTPPGRRWWARGAQMSREAWWKVATWRADAYETDDSWDSATAEEWAEVTRSVPILRMIDVIVARDNTGGDTPSDSG